MANFEVFCKLYHSYFSKSIDRDKEVWVEFVSQANENILRDALDTLEEVFATKKQGGYKVDPPTYPDVKREYWTLKNRDGSTDRKKFCRDGCVECDGTGSVLIVIHKGSGRPLRPDEPEAFAYGELAYTNTGCPHSYFVKRRDHKGFGPSHTMPLQLAHNFMMKCDGMKRRVGYEKFESS